MSHFPHIKYAGLSDVGRKRKNNEDSYGLFPEIGVFCVADGMGGGDDGEVASAATVHAVEMFAKANPLQPEVGYSNESMVAGLRGAVNSASSWILKRAQEKSLKGCGSTFVGLLLDPCRPDTPIALHAGDSRLYRIRGRSIQQITKDHSAAELIGAKDENEINPMFRGMILRAVGIQKSVDVDATPFQVKQGDRILICSDGLSKMISDKQIASIVKESDTVETAAKKLVSAANEAGGLDNVTVVLVEVGKLPPALPAVDLDVPRFDQVSDDTVHADRHTLDTSSETGVSFDLGTATSSTNTSCRTEGTGATEQATVTIPEDDSEGVADLEAFEAEASANTDNPADTASASEEDAKSKSKVGLWIVAAVIAVVVVAAAVIFFGARNKGGSGGERRHGVMPPYQGVRPYQSTPPVQISDSNNQTNASGEESEGKANAERIRQEQESKERKLRVEEERMRKEKEVKAEQDRLRKEAELKRVEEERIRREKEMERAKEEQRQKEDAARQKAERERLRREKEEALKRAEEERLRKEAELKKAEEERKRMEAEREQKAKLEKERAEKEKALLEKLARKKSAALAERRRKAAFEALRRVCEDRSAIAFVRKIQGIADKNSVNEICLMFRPVLTAHTKEEMEKSAASLIRVMQPIVVKLTECADMYKSDALAELKDPMTSADYKKELKDVPAKMDEFLLNSRRIIGKNAEELDVLLACVQMIEMVPLWFDSF